MINSKLYLQVKRKELASTTSKMVYRKIKGFGKVLWELCLDAIDAKVNSLKKLESPPHPKFIEGLSHIIPTLDTFLDTSLQESESEDFCIKVYDAVHLESGEILRTSGSFHGKEWFSDVAVTSAEDQRHYRSDEGAWYGKVKLT